ncbi:MAG TPA: isocitrate/isopropylmalate family dehydrogenase, partial [Candidatus Megaira endosymbiont of Hartmannula sinica]|nr:isocitrate/isopropylmalate family dehydrogenase [Candidatus Megaera endosymbiont of Hartmannula sinica]
MQEKNKLIDLENIKDSSTTRITICYGDGIGPEIMDSVLKILRYAEARISIDVVTLDLNYSANGNIINNDQLNTICKNKILLKAPITTPQGKGYKSINVILRRLMGLYSNIRPCISYHPYIESAVFQGKDLSISKLNSEIVIFRENEEDIYCGIEYKINNSLAQAIKITTENSSRRIIESAFQYAVKHGRKKISCMSKDNILKKTDGLFHKIFDEVACGYPSINTDHHIIDIGSARIASRPWEFDVIVTSNLYGDIISDIAAEVFSSVGMCGSANVGNNGFAMFEAIHGSAPDIAGMDLANPSGLLNSAIMMLRHINQPDIADKIEKSLRQVIEQGIHTKDIYNSSYSKKQVGLCEFTDHIIENINNYSISSSNDNFFQNKQANINNY